MNATFAKQIGALKIKDLRKHVKPDDYVYFLEYPYNPIQLITPELLDDYERFERNGYFKIIPKELHAEAKENFQMQNFIKLTEQNLEGLKKDRENMFTELKSKINTEVSTYRVDFYEFNGMGPGTDMTVEDVLLGTGEELIRFGRRYSHNQYTLWVALVLVRGDVETKPNIKATTKQHQDFKKKFQQIRIIHSAHMNKTGYRPDEDKFKSAVQLVLK